MTMTMTITELRALRKRGLVPRPPIIISLMGPLNLQNAVITDLNGDFYTFAELKVTVFISPNTPVHHTLRVVDRLVSCNVRSLLIDCPEQKKEISVIWEHMRYIHDFSYSYSGLIDASEPDFPF